MNLEALANPVIKTIVRCRKQCERIGRNLEIKIPAPFDDSIINKEVAEKLGINIPGAVRQLNAAFVEGVASGYAAQLKKEFEKEVFDFSPQEFVDSLIAEYDFSAVRGAENEDNLSDFDITIRSELRKLIRRGLAAGSFSGETRASLSVQTVKEAEENKLPEGKIALEDFELLIEAAAEKAVAKFQGRTYDFSVEPEFDEAGRMKNWGALYAVAEKEANDILAKKAEREKGLFADALF